MDLKLLRVIAPLATCLAALLTNNIIVVGLNGLVGYAVLGSDKSLATLPIATYIAGTAAATFPVRLAAPESRMADLAGRDRGFGSDRLGITVTLHEMPVFESSLSAPVAVTLLKPAPAAMTAPPCARRAEALSA
ncbi:hypothetical protein ABID59_004829 [Bradyrhizobium sp. S3.3.6]|uniref:hypothetical protein n=1 Tax=Bradyrhizobium sp. S3.3.6 TaxID=3156429 RepID=UPI003390C849